MVFCHSRYSATLGIDFGENLLFLDCLFKKVYEFMVKKLVADWLASNGNCYI